MLRTYDDLALLETFEDRYAYLRLRGSLGEITFGSERWLNQSFYRSKEWRDVRQHVIARDYGCDLGITGYDVHAQIHIHHMNPITADDVRDGNPAIIDPRYLISVSQITHNAIHYGKAEAFSRVPVPRREGDTKLW